MTWVTDLLCYLGIVVGVIIVTAIHTYLRDW